MLKRLRCGARWVLGFRKAEKQLAFHFFPPILGLVGVEFTYRGKTVDGAGIAFIKELIAQHPRLSRRGLSTKLCLAWNWVQANGHPRDMVCRGFLLGLHRAGLIELPAKRSSPPNPLARRQPPQALLDRSWEPIEGTLCGLGPIEIRQVRRTAQEKLFGSLMQAHHYLGYTQPVGEHLKYVYYAGQTPLACMAWSSSPRHLRARDRFIGWTAKQRRANRSLKELWVCSLGHSFREALCHG